MHQMMKLVFSDNKQHFLALVIFIGLTMFFTYPAFLLTSDHFLGYNGDPKAYAWEFWWYNKAIHSGISPFTSNYMFYPLGINFIASSPYDGFLSVALQTFLNLVQVYNLLLLSNFVFGGFTAYLLCNYLTKNFTASIIGGMIFTFSAYHMFDGMGSIELSTIYWIPTSLLFFLKSVNTTERKNPILAGIFLFLSVITSWYLGTFLFIGIVVLTLYFIAIKRKFDSSFLMKMLLIFTIFFTLMVLFIMPVKDTITSQKEFSTSLSEQDWYATDLVDFFLIPPFLTIVTSGLVQSHFIGNSWEAVTFLGYVTLALSLIAIIKIEKFKIIPWLVLLILFSVICLGPYLKIAGYETNLKLPDYYIFQLPFFDVLRALSRASVMVTIAIAVMASFGMTYILTNKFKSINSKIGVSILVGSLLIIESLTIPFPVTTSAAPQLYSEIRNERVDFAILEAPIGGPQGMSSDYNFDYYQTVHEKPMYGGYWARVPLETQTYTTTYFLNKFVYYDQQADIVDQNLNEVGISILNYFNVGYVIIHKQTSFPEFVGGNKKFVDDIRKTLLQIFNKSPDYEDSEIFSYKVPQSNSFHPFLLLGNGWSHLYLDNSRTVGKEATLKVINPGNLTRTKLEFELVSVSAPRKIEISSDQNNFSASVMPNHLIHIVTNQFLLKPGENTIFLTSNGSSLSGRPTLLSNMDDLLEINLIVKKVKLLSDQKEENGTIMEKQVNSKDLIPLIERQLNEIYYAELGRGLDTWGVTFFEPKIQDGNETFQWVKTVLDNSNEHKIWVQRSQK